MKLLALQTLVFSTCILSQFANASPSTDTNLPLSDPYKEASIKALALFPQTVKDIEIFTSRALETFQKDQLAFIEKSKTSLTYEGVVTSLDHMLQVFCWKKTTLAFLFFTTSDPAVLEKAKQATKRFDAALAAFKNNPALSDICSAYASKTLSDPITPSQNYLLVKLLQSLPSQKSHEEQYQALSKLPMQAWTYKKGDVPEKSLKDKITVLNWNVCFFPEGLSMLFGGVLPWQDRLSKVSDILKKQNSDVLCLQEVFSIEANEKLYHELKDTYAHFYTSIGPIQYGFNPGFYGLSSGLFVASKTPLHNLSFTPYTPKETPSDRWYGFFSATLQAGSSIRLITTHLQPGSSKEDQAYRASQIRALDASIDDETLTFICGDFNLERMGAEYKNSLQSYFINYYDNPEWTCLDLRDYWWKANQNAQTFYSKYRSPEWIDYFLQSTKSSSTSLSSVKSVPILVNDPHIPSRALSDHQAIFSTITLH